MDRWSKERLDYNRQNTLRLCSCSSFSSVFWVVCAIVKIVEQLLQLDRGLGSLYRSSVTLEILENRDLFSL